MTDNNTMEELQHNINSLLHEINELKKIITVKNEQDNAFRDLIIDYLVNKKDVKIGDSSSSSSTVKTTQKQKKNNDTELIDVYHKNLYEYLVQNNYTYFDYVESFTKANIDVMDDKLKDNSANNVRNCFVWCYSHVNDIRIIVLDLPNVENFVTGLYNNKTELVKHNKTLNELLKYEGNEIFKNYKDETYFKTYCNSLKQKYKKLTDS